MKDISISAYEAQVEAMNAFFRRVYHWMAAGLIMTAVAAHWVASDRSLRNVIFSSPGNVIALIIVELGLVLAISWGINRLSVGLAMGMFIFYSLLNGVTLSTVLLFYTRESVVSAFLTTAGMFGAMSIYGLYTKRDLTSWRSCLIMGLWGIVIAGCVNLFMRNGTTDLVISAVGILVFMGLTAYDTQYLRNLGGQVDIESGDATVQKLAVLGALHLYLDFINLFLYLLRFFGKQK